MGRDLVCLALITVAACGGVRADATHPETRRSFDASRLRTGRFSYHTTLEGKDAGNSTISIDRTDEATYRFRNEVTGMFRQTWESTATRAFQPLSASLGLGANDNKSVSMRLVYEGQAVHGTATKADPVLGPQTNTVSARIPEDTVDQRIDWAVMVASETPSGQPFHFSVYDPWIGVSRVSAHAGAAEQVRVPAGAFDAHRMTYRIEKSSGTVQYVVWVSEQAPCFLVREDFPNGAITELTQMMN